MWRESRCSDLWFAGFRLYQLFVKQLDLDDSVVEFLAVFRCASGALPNQVDQLAALDGIDWKVVATENIASGCATMGNRAPLAVKVQVPQVGE